MKMERKRKNSGFTLIEMLVVIVIIVALMGLVFKLTGQASEAANRAATVKTLERLRTAIEEFHSTYGTYPPCIGAGYTDLLEGGYSPEVREEVLEALKGTDSKSGTRIYGLRAYLQGVQKTVNGMGEEAGFEMTEADEEFVRRVKPYVKGLDVADLVPMKTGSGKAYTNLVVTYLDGWGREIIYESRSPYVTYKLYSVGQDGAHGDKDKDKDNIEGGLDL